MTNTIESIINDQRHFFATLESFFERATGFTIAEFAQQGRFDAVIRANAKRIAKRGNAFPWLETELRPYYAKVANSSYELGKVLGGMKLVIGGGSMFGASQLGSVRKVALYSDTVFIPDPVLPWIEDDRSEERYRHARLLEVVFFLLHLKPLVDAELPFPAVVVFPSWERSLERKDETTQQGLTGLITAFMSHYLGTTFASFPDVFEFARRHPTELLAKVDEAKLFVAPEGIVGEPLEHAVARYRDVTRHWRSAEYIKQMEGVSDAEVVVLGIAERLSPQYHLLENADAFRSQPLLCLDQPWFYHTKIAAMLEGQLEHAGLLTPKTIATLRGLMHPTVEWLGNVPLESLAILRGENANEDFRKRMTEYTTALSDAQLDHIDQVAAEVGHGLAAMMAGHQREVDAILESYQKRYLKTLQKSLWLTAGPLLAPVLGPLAGAVPALKVASEYVTDKVEERQALAKASRSLTGVLAKAHKSGKD